MIALKRLIFAGIGFLILGMTQVSAQVQYGEASYYADKYHLKSPTASGELYDKYKFTAAHRTLKFGTILKVTHLENKRSVTVRINDRGPYKDGRIVDLSRVAAEQIGLITEGVAKVKIEVVVEGTTTTAKNTRSSSRRAESIDLTDNNSAKDVGRDLSKLPLRDHTGTLVNDSRSRSTHTPVTTTTTPTRTIPVNTGSTRRVQPEFREITEMDLGTTNTDRSSSTTNRRLASANTAFADPALSEAEKYTPNIFRMIAIKDNSSGFAVQLGAFYSYYRLLEGLSKINSKGVENTLVQSGMKDGKPIFRILAGPYSNKAAADQAKKGFSRRGMKGLTVNLSTLN
ncbi:MAG: septal ring lytic transglycosylase RlpA family protein [Bacteroidia bacterium]|nr:septal ring lytic transglycosylase RlpA family protein [Bacteroidia bacterium]